MKKKTKKLMIYDATTIKDGWDGFGNDGLAYSWFAGSRLYRWARWLDEVKGVTSWEEALDWVLEQGKDAKISQIQYWGHGSWGNVWIGKTALNKATVTKDSELHRKWAEVKKVLSDDALIWFRTCSTFGNGGGQAFARRFTDFMECKVAAHTHIIGPLQGGLHSLSPGQDIYWPQKEGVLVGDNGKESSLWTEWKTPNTIVCLRGVLPEGW